MAIRARTGLHGLLGPRLIVWIVAGGALRFVRIIIRKLNENTHGMTRETRGFPRTQRRPPGVGRHGVLALLDPLHGAQEAVTGCAVDREVAHATELDLGFVVTIRLTAGLVGGRELVN